MFTLPNKSTMHMFTTKNVLKYFRVEAPPLYAQKIDIS